MPKNCPHSEIATETWTWVKVREVLRAIPNTSTVSLLSTHLRQVQSSGLTECTVN